MWTRLHCFLVSLGGVCFIAISSSRRCPHSLAHSPLLPSSKPAKLSFSVPFSHSHISFWLSPPVSLNIFKDFCDYIYPNNLDSLPVLRSANQQSLPCTTLYSQMLGIRMWTALWEVWRQSQQPIISSFFFF